MLVSIIGPRVEEIFSAARDEITKARISEYIGAGVVVTGGGASMPGISEVAEEIFALPVRIGAPNELLPGEDLGLNPKFSTAVGLVKHAAHRYAIGDRNLGDGDNWIGRTSSKVRNWFQGII